MMKTWIAITVVLICGVGSVAFSQHDKHGPGAKIKLLMQQDVTEKLDGKEARISIQEVVFEPGKSSPPHRHPGPIFGYVLEGEFETGLNDEPAKTLKAGDTFYEPTMVLHAISRNPSKVAKTRVLAVMLHPRDAKELVILEP
jgi:quercetin dioxygenase-like cupin family protein